MISSFDGAKFITLPENFCLTKRDKRLIEINKVTIHRCNPNLSLSQSILNFIIDLNLVGTFNVMRLAAELMDKNEPDELWENQYIL